VGKYRQKPINKARSLDGGWDECGLGVESGREELGKGGRFGEFWWVEEVLMKLVRWELYP
jgi:hypothetical protein